MSDSPGKHLVDIEIREFKRKLVAAGGRKYLKPHEKAAEIHDIIDRIKRISRDHKADAYFSTQEFKTILNGLEGMLEPTLVDSH